MNIIFDVWKKLMNEWNEDTKLFKYFILTISWQKLILQKNEIIFILYRSYIDTKNYVIMISYEVAVITLHL